MTDDAIAFMESEQEEKPEPIQRTQSNQVINIGSGSISLNGTIVGNNSSPEKSPDDKGIRWAKIGVIVAVIIGIATVLTSVVTWFFP